MRWVAGVAGRRWTILTGRGLNGRARRRMRGGRGPRTRDYGPRDLNFAEVADHHPLSLDGRVQFRMNRAALSRQALDCYRSGLGEQPRYRPRPTQAAACLRSGRALEPITTDCHASIRLPDPLANEPANEPIGTAGTVYFHSRRGAQRITRPLAQTLPRADRASACRLPGDAHPGHSGGNTIAGVSIRATGYGVGPCRGV